MMAAVMFFAGVKTEAESLFCHTAHLRELLCTLMRNKVYKHIKHCDIAQLLLQRQRKTATVIRTAVQMPAVLNDCLATTPDLQQLLKSWMKQTS